MVSPAEWGPGAWTLLHGIAERVGNHSNHLLIRDERNELKLTLRHFSALLPCLKCQKHYGEYLILYPPDQWIQGPFGEDLRDSMRLWLYRLHEKVNASNDVISGIELAELKEKYNSVPLKERANSLKSFYQRGLDIRTLKAENWKTAWKHLDLLLRII